MVSPPGAYTLEKVGKLSWKLSISLYNYSCNKCYKGEVQCVMKEYHGGRVITEPTDGREKAVDLDAIENWFYKLRCKGWEGVARNGVRGEFGGKIIFQV